ncbi:MAG: 3-phosphoshikimate 1-carboxyvinyltransferase [Flavobacteriaceae bacterium]|nr:3-phosphoshikimate 1-carboxyvinyltransferase [Flavobacteriaceae bacterium]
MIQISHPTSEIDGEITISGSKSESNRWLILQQIFPQISKIHNLSTAEDTQIMQAALTAGKSQENRIINVGHAGTVMRFLTAFFAVQDGYNVILTGSDRMKSRPVRDLVSALVDLGCDIQYLENEGFPPLMIHGTSQLKNEVQILGEISSQFITALLLVAPSLAQGLTVNILGELTSMPYVEMTISQLNTLGIQTHRMGKTIQVFSQKEILPVQIRVESDWSSASYWYSLAALSTDCNIQLKFYKSNSYQGDAVVKDLYFKYFGIQTQLNENKLEISKIKKFKFPDFVELNLNQTPDLAQTIIVTCAGLKIKAKLTGLQTLKIKETDRLFALLKELLKMGVNSEISDNSIEIISFENFNQIPIIHTYEDHRMAMSFAPLALKFPIRIDSEKVVNKSYPEFWNDLEKVSFHITH